MIARNKLQTKDKLVSTLECYKYLKIQTMLSLDFVALEMFLSIEDERREKGKKKVGRGKGRRKRRREKEGSQLSKECVTIPS